MSDFVAVLKRTLDGLGETTPDIRKRVYDKARSTIAAKLEAMNPPPAAAVADRQRSALESAIAEVEAGFKKPASKNEPLDELEQVLNSLNGLKNQPVTPVKAAPPAPKTEPITPRPMTTPRPPAGEIRAPASELRPQPAPAPRVEPRVAPEARPTQEAKPAPRVAPVPEPIQALRPAPAPKPAPIPAADRFEPPLAGTVSDFDAPFERDRSFDSAPRETETRKSGGFGRLLVSGIVLAAVAVGGYFGWENRDRLTTLASEWMPSSSPSTPTLVSTPASQTPPASSTAAAPTTPAPTAPSANPATPTNQAAPGGQPAKFTQRLNADGSEADAGPASGEPQVGEGTSVAEATQGAAQPGPATPETPTPVPPEGQPATPATPTPATPAPGTPAATAGGEQPAGVAVGQKAIFYEERTNNAAGSAEPGNIKWSVVQESPGGDLPPEPAIRGEASVPGRNVQLRITIRRNADKTLPASQIIEMIFVTPPNFEGGGVANVLRVALKGSEQDPGTPLTGIPAKISDGFFLIALSDVKAEESNNAKLLLDRSWLDIPLVYQSGRRALITLEKGPPGTATFQDVIKSWNVQTN